MRLFLNGNYIHLKKYQDSPIDEYKIIVKSGNGERTVIDVRARVRSVISRCDIWNK